MFRVAANSSQRGQKLLILCYHGLSLDDEHEWYPHLYITPELFRRRLQRLRDWQANVLPLGEALERLHDNTLPARSVAITFDDGFYDFVRHAVPILSEFSYPCTLYLTTYYCSHRLPVITVFLDYLLWKSKLEQVAIPDFGLPETRHVRSYPERQQVVKKILAWMHEAKVDTSGKHDVACQIAVSLGINVEDLMKRRMLQIMSADEAASISRAGIDLQLHTHRHRTPRDVQLFRREIIDNRQKIEEITGKIPLHFCYPSGHHVPEFIPWLQELGVKSATTCERGLAGASTHDLTLPRVLDDMTVEDVRFDSLFAGVLA